MNHPDGPEFEPEPEDGRPAGLSQADMDVKGLAPAEIMRDDWSEGEPGDVQLPIGGKSKAESLGEATLPTGSDITLPESLKDDADAKQFVIDMQSEGVDSEVTGQVISWYEANQAAQQQEIQQHDERAMRDGMAELRTAWGAERDRNLDEVREFLYAAPAGIAGALANARLPTGVPLGSDCQFLMWVHKLQRGRGGEAAVSYSKDATRISEIEEIMKTDRHRYTRDEALQAELRQLYERRGS